MPIAKVELVSMNEREKERGSERDVIGESTISTAKETGQGYALIIAQLIMIKFN